MKKILIAVLCIWMGFWGKTCWAQTNGPITVGQSEAEPGDITLSGTITQHWSLRLDHSIHIYNLSVKKGFETSEVELLDNDCNNCDENWEGSHVIARGSLDEDVHDPMKTVFWLDRLEGQPQPLIGPLYDPYSDNAHLTGILVPVHCNGITYVELNLDQPINVGKGGEFSGPVYGLKNVQLLYLDKRQGLQGGPVTVDGYFDYTADDFDGLVHYSLSDPHCPDMGLPLLVTRITGARDNRGNPVGLREILVRSEWKALSKQGQDDRESEMERSLEGLRDLTDKDRIAIVENGEMDCAYQMVDGEKTEEIKNIQPKADLKVLVQRFYGLE